MATAALLPMPRAVFFDANGNLLSGGLVYTYVPGGSTLKLTWQDAAETILNANPIVLDADGSCLLYGSGNYQITVTDALGNAIPAYSGLTTDVLGGLAGQVFQAVANIAALRASTTTTLVNGYAYVLGYYTTADGGEGPFVTGVSVSDNGGTIINDASGRSWYREGDGTPPSVKWFGAKGDGVTNDRAAIAAAEAVAGSGPLWFPPAVYAIDSAGITKGRSQWLGHGATLKGSAGTYANGLVFATGVNDFVVNGFNFDVDLGTYDNGVMAFNTCSDYVVENNVIDGNFKYGLVHNTGNGFRFSGNRILLTTAVNTQNQGILVSTFSGAVRDALVENNYLLNTAIDFSGQYCTLRGNSIFNWKFGAGITTEIDPLCGDLKIIENVCIGGTGTDVNATVCLGIENWAPRSQISGNTCASNAGVGISNGGQNSDIYGNDCFNNGQLVPSPGITSRFSSGAVNGNYSNIYGNCCVDTQTPHTQSYGYSDENSNMFGCWIGPNTFTGNLTGPMRILGINSTTTPSFQNFVTFSPGTVASGSSVGGTLTVSGATFGDIVSVSFSNDLQSVKLWGWISAINTVTFRMENNSGVSAAFSTGTICAICTKRNDYTAY